MARKITLTQDKSTLVDDEDFEYLNRFKWHWGNDGYAVRKMLVNEGRRGGKIYMHRVILNTPKNMQVDHINHNRLDNRRLNLRNCSHQKNTQNSKPHKGNTSGFKGVTWNKREKKFKGHIRIDDKSIHLGYFKDPVEGAKAYDKAAREAWGEFAYLNFPERG